MAFWDTFAKVGASAAAITAVGAVAGKTASSIANSRHKRQMEKQKLALEEEKMLADRELKIRELESKERRDYASLDTDVKIQEIRSNYHGESKSGRNIIFDRSAPAPAPEAQPQPTIEYQANDSKASTTDVQQKILDAYEMKKNGILTDEEFAAMKQQILMGK